MPESTDDNIEESLQLRKQRLELEHEERLRRIEIEEKELEIEEKKLKLQAERLRQEFEINKNKVNLKNQERLSAAETNSYVIMSILKGTSSLILLGSGIWLTFAGNNIGAFMMGTGATGVGIEATKLLKPGSKDGSDQADPVSEGKSKPSSES